MKTHNIIWFLHSWLCSVLVLPIKFINSVSGDWLKEDTVSYHCFVQLPCLTFDHEGSLLKRSQHSSRRVMQRSPPAGAACSVLLVPAFTLSGSGKLSNTAPQGELSVQTLGVQVCCGKACRKNGEREGEFSENLLVIRQNISAVFFTFTHY